MYPLDLFNDGDALPHQEPRQLAQRELVPFERFGTRVLTAMVQGIFLNAVAQQMSSFGRRCIMRNRRLARGLRGTPASLLVDASSHRKPPSQRKSF
jgi:hypothetical protein